jgi:Tfp pilus assembly protein PilO
MLVAVNLLPPDRRPKEATPLGVLLPLLGGVALLSTTAAFWGWLRFSELASAEAEREEVTATLASKKAALDYLAALRSEQTDFETRTKTIK